ncbi:MAG: tRNA lysidine(34) synthetase TilS [Oscillospiraceae bacterium]|jgi:tRNA(Ile)-lysidine synthase|nr:tRNA lysidine(34) synthetase TilS [Oscillospiraceae bacterium]
MGGSFDRMVSLAEAALRGQGMIPQGALALAAVSGGADSTALVLALDALREKMGFRLEAAHVEHGIRGRDSLEDARFVGELCDRLGVRLSVKSVDAPKEARESGGGLEDAARRVRYDAFRIIAKERGADRIALAHHREDQAETVLLHMIRGGGVSGLEGMRAVRGMYIRPLLDVEPSLLRGALREIGQPWREDATNADPSQPRAMLRHQAMPLFRRVNPAASRALARMAALASRDNDYMDALALAFLDEAFARTAYGAFIEGLYDLHAAVASRALRLTARRLGLEPWESRHIESMLGLRSGEAANLPRGWTAKRVAGRMHALAPEDSRRAFSYDPAMIGVEPADGKGFGDGLLVQTAPRALLDQAAWRARKPGDWWTPFGSRGRQLVSDALINRKIDEPFRACVPMLAIGSEILWAVGVGASERLRVESGADMDDYVMLSWRGCAPWSIA